MSSPNPHHAVLVSLLERNQFDACRMAVEDLIAQEMAAPAPNDRELACLHLLLCRALLGLEDYEAAALKAEFAALEARKAKAPDLLAEALFRAGNCYSEARNHSAAIERLTECLQLATGIARAKVLFNRGHTYQRQHAYSEAVADYEEAITAAVGQEPKLVRTCRINLAWVLILLREFDRAETVLAELAGEPGAESDQGLQTQLAHDRLHMAHLTGRNREAFKQAMTALRRAGRNYPHIKARIALTLMAIAEDRNLHEQAFALGMFSQRLAGEARRPDIDAEAGKRMQQLEFHAGTEPLARVLLRLRQISYGSAYPHKAQRKGHETGGAV